MAWRCRRGTDVGGVVWGAELSLRRRVRRQSARLALDRRSSHRGWPRSHSSSPSPDAFRCGWRSSPRCCRSSSAVAVGGALLALGTVATRLRTRDTAITGAATLVGLLLVGTIYPTPQTDVPWWVHVIVMGLGVAVVVAVGIAIGQRRSLVAGLRERADAAERTQQAREAEARADERTRIAHDMHDVVAHRISLVAMHAAALGFRPDIDEDARRQSVRTIEDNARLALDELREVLGVLSATNSATPTRRGRAWRTVRALVRGRSGGGDDDRPAGVGRVRAPDRRDADARSGWCAEALTNARKHAEGARRDRLDRGRTGRRARGARAQRRSDPHGWDGSAGVSRRGLTGLGAGTGGPARAGRAHGRSDRGRATAGRRLRDRRLGTMGAMSPARAHRPGGR